MARVTTRMLQKLDACRALGVSADTFERHWQRVFTDCRAAHERGRGGARRLVFEDELGEALSHGGGARAKAAVLTFRKLMGRMEDCG